MLDRLNDFRSRRRSSRNSAVPHRTGLTTVYRTLQTLVDAGEIDIVRTGSGAAVYRRCTSSGHHHHLVCRHCGRTVEIEGPTVESWAEHVAEAHGFSELSLRWRLSGFAAHAWPDADGPYRHRDRVLCRSWRRAGPGRAGPPPARRSRRPPPAAARGTTGARFRVDR
ncbi:transcriptional repressor [Pseudonocardia sp.]|uniref:Fur family transcriptional regulator n=1 Tax=Pseudonocardia sp. TaxID=60912 RepID=UPI0031FD1DD4